MRLRSGRRALAQLLVAGSVIVFVCGHAQAQPGYVAPPPKLPPPVFYPSSPHRVSQPKYEPHALSENAFGSPPKPLIVV